MSERSRQGFSYRLQELIYTTRYAFNPRCFHILCHERGLIILIVIIVLPYGRCSVVSLHPVVRLLASCFVANCMFGSSCSRLFGCYFVAGCSVVTLWLLVWLCSAAGFSVVPSASCSVVPGASCSIVILKLVFSLLLCDRSFVVTL